jgi:hypothetical protein
MIILMPIKKITIFIVLALIMSNCSKASKYSSEIDVSKDSKFLEMVEKYLNREVADKRFGSKPKKYAACAYELLGSKVKNDSSFEVYLWTFCKGKFAKENLPEYGSVQPVALEVKSKNDLYKIIGYKVPKDAGSSPTIQEIFPRDIQKKIPDARLSNYNSLKRKLEDRVDRNIQNQIKAQ